MPGPLVVGIAYDKDGNEGEQDESAKQGWQENAQVQLWLVGAC